jgi:hypothetical protein
LNRKCSAGCKKSVETNRNCHDSPNVLKRIGEEGVEKIFQASAALHGEKGQEREVIVDTTVQEKNITFPTDTKLRVKIIAVRL